MEFKCRFLPRRAYEFAAVLAEMLVLGLKNKVVGGLGNGLGEGAGRQCSCFASVNILAFVTGCPRILAAIL